MPIEASELVALRDALIRARATGTRSIEYEGKRVIYGTDAEMAAVLADLERRLARMSSAPVGSVRFRVSKGT